jgi:hypothetical protein
VNASDGLIQNSREEVAQMSAAPFNKHFEAALQAFVREANAYCEHISEHMAHQYAVQFTNLLESRARKIAMEEPRNPGLFEPNRNLIRSTLRGIYQQHFGPANRRQ